MAQASQATINAALAILKATALKYPRAFQNCHANNNTHPERLDYIILACRELVKLDPLFGMNGKRGNKNDPSSDAIFYGTKSESSSVIDILTAAGETNTIEEIKWSDVSADGPGVWVDPNVWDTEVDYSNGGTTPPVVDCSKCEKELATLKANSVKKVLYDEAK